MYLIFLADICYIEQKEDWRWRGNLRQQKMGSMKTIVEDHLAHEVMETESEELLIYIKDMLEACDLNTADTPQGINNYGDGPGKWSIEKN